MKLGINREQAFQWANTRKGYWRTAGSGILNVALSNHYLEMLGFPNLAKRYEELRARARRLEMLHATH
jgi:RNA-directed DNA polymerase